MLRQVLFTVENAVLSISQPPPGLPFIEMSLEPLLRCLDCDILPQLFAVRLGMLRAQIDSPTAPPCVAPSPLSELSAAHPVGAVAASTLAF